MNIDYEPKLDFDDVLLVPQRSVSASRKDVDVTRLFKFYHSDREWVGTPIMAANMSTTGSFNMAESLNQFSMITCLQKHHSFDELKDFFKNAPPDLLVNSWISIGMKKSDFHKLDAVVEECLPHMPNICIDIANGYTQGFVDYCAEIRDYYSMDNLSPIIMAGNVCTPEMVSELIMRGGVDIVKVGIGPGSACTTRLKTGVGYPQLSAIAECAHAAHGLKSEDKRLGLVCADGGCRTPADVCKAFAANADFVMLGGMLAGVDECDGDWQYKWKEEVCTGHPMGDVRQTPTNEKKSLTFYGMSSEEAQEKFGNGMSEYCTSEGRIKSVPYKGLAKDVIQDILGGLRSSCSYIGANSLKDMAKCAKFIKVSRTHFDQTL